MRRPQLLLAAAALFLLVVGIWAYLRYVGSIPGDERLFNRAKALGNTDNRRQLTNFFGDLGTASVAAITVGTAAVVVGRSVGTRGALVVLLAGGGVFFNDVVRATLGSTPSAAAAFYPAAESYPSGHVVYVTTVFGALAWLGHRHGRRDVTVICLAIVAAMGPARVIGGTHLPSDVVGGYALGGAWLLAAIAVLSPSSRARRASRAG